MRLTFKNGFMQERTRRQLRYLPWAGMIGAPGYPAKNLWQPSATYDTIDGVEVDYDSNKVIKEVRATSSGGHVAKCAISYNTSQKWVEADLYDDSTHVLTWKETLTLASGGAGNKLVLEVTDQTANHYDVKITGQGVSDDYPKDSYKYDLKIEFQGQTYETKNNGLHEASPPACIKSFFDKVNTLSGAPVALPLPVETAQAIFGHMVGIPTDPTIESNEAELICEILCAILWFGFWIHIVCLVVNKLIIVPAFS